MIATAPAATMYSAPASEPGLKVSTERLRCLLLWLTGASGAIVFIEPSPYEVVSFLTLAMFVIGGLTLSVRLMPLIVLLVLINIGYSISGWLVLDDEGIAMWLVTSWYLALTAIFLAAMLTVNTGQRLDAITRGCVIGGVIASIAAIVGYSRVIGSLNELLLLYDRARGTFKDPNVLGAFLVFPTLLALQPVLSGTFKQAVKGALLLGLMVPAVLLSFSRAAWGQTVYCSLIMIALTFITTRSSSHRLRLVLLSLAGIAVLTVGIAALLSIDAIAELFKQRASLHQSYDVGAQGRFARYGLGFILSLDKPLGIGPLQFHKYFPEDTHDSFLNAFMSGGWLTGACYPALIALTLVFGLRATFVRTPWQPTAITVFAAYFGVTSESIIIDTDHWRHNFLLMGLMWGLIAASRNYAIRDKRPAGLGGGAPSVAGLAPSGGASYTSSRRSVAQPG
jgi:hypothetical protein